MCRGVLAYWNMEQPIRWPLNRAVLLATAKAWPFETKKEEV